MKNYLFTPFKKKIEKINAFNELKSTIISCIDEKNVDISYAITPLIVFVGQLESYYDVIIEELKATNYHDEIKDLHKERDDLYKACKLLKDDNKELKADNERLRIENNTLKLSNGKIKDELQSVNDDYNNDHRVHNEYEDGLLDEVKELKAEIKEKEEQYHMLASSKTSHYPKEYKAEADEYFHHNPQCKKLLFFILDGNDFDWDEDNDGCNGMNGEYNSILFADDCIAEFDNNEGSE